MKKYFLSPLFAPIFTLTVWMLMMNIIFALFPNSIPAIGQPAGLIENITHTSYIMMIFAFLISVRDFKGAKLKEYIMLFALGIMGFLEETSEVLLPIIAIIMLLQYHYLKKKH
ncbi:MAG: hypothetical protein LBR35_01800 [Rickettsiales bacterium]|jgi:hypothetical protein|nr:hypothetical protein [Rickettsiales bacterium]